MRLAPREFLRRFLLHVLPRGFVRIRHYGLLANGCRRDKLQRCRELIPSAAAIRHDQLPGIAHDGSEPLRHDDARERCPACGELSMVRIAHLDPTRSTGPPATRAA